MDNIGYNSVSGEMLRGYVERMERLAEQKSALSDDMRVVMAEAKSAGFVPKIIKKICKERAEAPNDVAEEKALLDTYRHAMGMDNELPLFRHLEAAAVDLTKREEVISALKFLVPSNGSIQLELADGKPVRLTRDKAGNISIQEIMLKPMGGAEPAEYGSPALRGGKVDVPEGDADQAETLGREAFAGNVPIIRNPFPWGDARRARWDKGWRDASGSDGMGPGKK